MLLGRNSAKSPGWCHTEPVRQLTCLMVTAMLAAMLTLTGCARHIDGSATGSHAVDPTVFFAGDVPVYEQSVSPNDMTALAYLRAMRRIDVCGLLDRENLAKVGEIGSVGTLVAFDQCQLDIKVAGQTHRNYATIKLTLTHRPDGPVAFRAGPLPVYESYPEACDFLLPLDLAGLPGARQLHKPVQPYLRVGLVAGQSCKFARRIMWELASRVVFTRLPTRDAVAAYPAALAERDPCQVLSVLGDEVDHWDIGKSRPYECAFGIWRDGYPDVVPIRVSLEPQLVDTAVEGRLRENRDGVELFVDETHCSAVSFVGEQMKRRLYGVDFADSGDVDIRPAVVVDGDGSNCNAVTAVTVVAAKLYS